MSPALLLGNNSKLLFLGLIYILSLKLYFKKYKNQELMHQNKSHAFKTKMGTN